MLLPNLEKDEDPVIIEDHLRERLPDSLRELALNPITNVGNKTKIAKTVATLKLYGGVQRLKPVSLEFIGSEILLDIGQSPLATAQLRTRVMAETGDTFAEAQLKLKN